MLIDYLFYLCYYAYSSLFKGEKLIAGNRATALVGIIMVIYAWWMISLATAGVIELSGGHSQKIVAATVIPAILLSPLPLLYAHVRYKRKDHYVRILEKFEGIKLGAFPLAGALLFVGLSMAGLARIAIVLRAWILAGY